uniref:Uncharacterized protein n=1 Tax=Romanomermis culicivorax TaxID=13658 RepID=A0A915KF19_ROMCU
MLTIRVCASTAQPEPVAPPPMINTSNSGVDFKASRISERNGKGAVGRTFKLSSALAILSRRCKKPSR